MAEEGLFLPVTEEGFFPWAGPLAQYRHRHGLNGLLPPTIAPQNPVVRAPRTEMRVLVTSSLRLGLPHQALH